MKKGIAILVLISISVVIIAKVYAWCQTDYKCVNDCVNQGYVWQLCKKACSWGCE